MLTFPFFDVLGFLEQSNHAEYLGCYLITNEKLFYENENLVLLVTNVQDNDN